jgi:hypothetical protein
MATGLAARLPYTPFFHTGSQNSLSGFDHGLVQPILNSARAQPGKSVRWNPRFALILTDKVGSFSAAKREA